MNFNDKIDTALRPHEVKIPCPVSDADLAYYDILVPVFARHEGHHFPKFPENELLEIFLKLNMSSLKKINEWEQESATIF